MNRKDNIPVVLLIGLFSGIMAGLMGVGGGVVMVPAMVWLLGFTQHRAHGTSLAMMVFLSMTTAAAYAWQGSVNWFVAATLVPGGIIGARIGASYTKKVPAKQLKLYFSIFLILTGARMMYAGLFGGMKTYAMLEGPPALVAGLATGLLTGIVSGMLGVGGGIVMVPIMALVLGLQQQIAQGTSLVAIIPTAISGAKRHKELGNVDDKCAIILILGSLPGGYIGSYLANQLPSLTLKTIFGGFLIFVSVLMMLQTNTKKEAG